MSNPVEKLGTIHFARGYLVSYCHSLISAAQERRPTPSGYCRP